MFHVRTTFVLGAGASCGYGYPLGDELISKIIEKAENARDQAKHPAHSPFLKQFEQLIHALRFYDPISIDAFLRNYRNEPKLIAAAKMLIAEVLLDSGDDTRFTRGALDGNNNLINWYRFFWDALVSNSDPAHLANEEVSLNFNVITFNYDTSLEYYLYTRATDGNSMFTKKQQSAFLSKLSKCIHHVYGHLLHYKWLGGGDDDNELYFSDYGELLTTKARDVASNILLIDERDDQDYERFRKIIRESWQVLFLGFGFDETNVGGKVLALESSLRSIEEGLYVRPMVKYTNFSDSSKIDKKMESLLASNREKYGDRVVCQKSAKPVYEAIRDDFLLTSR